MLYIYSFDSSRIDEKGYCFPRIETFKGYAIIDDDENTILIIELLMPEIN